MIGRGGVPAEGHRGRRLRRQPPVHSPISPSQVLRAALGAVRGADDPRNVLRRRLADRFQADGVQLCETGTQALELAIRVARILARGAGPVAVPAFTCYDVATAAVGARVRVVLYDVSPDTLSPDFGSWMSALRRGARVLVVTPLYGYPPDWSALSEAAADYGAIVIEDAAQGQGASWRGQPLGGLGQLSVLSFGRGKGWTGGRGGACLARGDAAARILAGCRVPPAGLDAAPHAMAAALGQAALAGPEFYWIPASIPGLHLGRTIYRPPSPMRSMTRFTAGLVLETEGAAGRAARDRRAVGKELLERIIPTGSVKPIHPLDAEGGGFLRLPLLLSFGMAGFVSSSEARRLGIEVSYPSTLADLLPLRARLDHPVTPCPGADHLARHLVTLPTHGGLDAHEREHLLRLVDSYGGSTCRNLAERGGAGSVPSGSRCGGSGFNVADGRHCARERGWFGVSPSHSGRRTVWNLRSVEDEWDSVSPSRRRHLHRTGHRLPVSGDSNEEEKR